MPTRCARSYRHQHSQRDTLSSSLRTCALSTPRHFIASLLFTSSPLKHSAAPASQVILIAPCREASSSLFSFEPTIDDIISIHASQNHMHPLARAGIAGAKNLSMSGNGIGLQSNLHHGGTWFNESTELTLEAVNAGRNPYRCMLYYQDS